MSQSKRKSVLFLMILAIISFFAFGCESKTPVEGIYFNIEDSEQIVLVKGQSLDISDLIVIQPTIASNKSYTLTSLDPEYVSVSNTTITAEKIGEAKILVVSKDNHIKQDIMNVSVMESKEVLPAPTNLSYNADTEMLSFESVDNASSYTLKLNGTIIELGNSTSYSMKDYKGDIYNNLLVAQVKANTSEHVYAFESSGYSGEYKFYHCGAVSNVELKGGKLSFTGVEGADYKVYINNDLLCIMPESTTLNNILDIGELNPEYAGGIHQIYIEAVVSDSKQAELGNKVYCPNSKKVKIDVSVLAVPTLSVNKTIVSWQNITNSSLYAVFVNGIQKATVATNYFDLEQLVNNETISSTNASEIKVVPILSDNVKNVLSTSGYSAINVKALSTPVISTEANTVKWQNDENASLYNVKLVGTDIDFESSTESTSLSMANYAVGNYVLKVKTLPVKPAVDGVYYMPSKEVEFEFAKKEIVSAVVEDYVLKLTDLNNGDKCLVTFDIDSQTPYEEIVTGDGSVKTVDLSDFEFSAESHNINIIRLGDSQSVDSDINVKTFIQLEAIDVISLSHNVASVNVSDINKNGIIKLVTSSDKLSEDKVVEDSRVVFNSTDAGEDRLAAGIYTVKVFVLGDGSATFSCRDKGVEVATSEINFEVLDAPTCTVLNYSQDILNFSKIDNATAYNIYKLGDTVELYNENPIPADQLEYEIDLASGETATFAVQALGNNSNVFSSAIFENKAAIVTREVTPELYFNNKTNVLTHNVESGYSVELKHNGVIQSYDFFLPFNLDLTTNVFELTTVARIKSGNTYYLNSKPFRLELDKISNEAIISLDQDNNLVIAPNAHSEEYLLQAEMILNGATKTFISNNGSLVCEDWELPYTYSDNKYTISLLNSDNNAIVSAMNSGFEIRVKFIKESTGNDTQINSEYTDWTSLSFNPISCETNISVNTNNQLVLAPVGHAQQYVLNLKIKGIDFVGVDGVLRSSTFELSYKFENSKYFIDLLDENYNSIITTLGNEFSVQVKYLKNSDATYSDVDSVYCEEKTVSVLPTATLQVEITEDQQKIKFNNVISTYTWADYALLVDNQLLLLNNTAVATDGFIEFEANYIFETLDLETGVAHILEVITLNNRTSADNLLLSAKSAPINIEQANSLVLNWIKDNDAENNSVVISFETYETEYDKNYVVELFNGDKPIRKIYTDDDAQNGVVAFNLDSCNLEEIINVVAYVETEDYTNNIYSFNSFNSNQLQFVRAAKTTNLYIADNILHFDAVAHSVGYEVYRVENNEYIKCNTNLLTVNNYNVADMVGLQELVVKVISTDDGYTNSLYSEKLIINKLAEPQIRLNGGNFEVVLPTTVTELIAIEDVEVSLEITNEIGNITLIDLKNVAMQGVSIDENNTVVSIDAEVLLTYSSDTLKPEKLQFVFKTDYVESTSTDVNYINSNIVNYTAHGLFAATNVEKTTNENNSVELLQWIPNVKNIINTTNIPVGYIFKLVYTTEDGTSVPYYSNDPKLKYYNAETSSYESYAAVITANNVIFPAGYGEIVKGVPEIVFGAGFYSISVQTIPYNANIADYNLCASRYSAEHTFEIMSTPTMEVAEGVVAWNKLDNATAYKYAVYQYGQSTALIEKTENVLSYDFLDEKLSNYSGLLTITVQAISSMSNVLNSAVSEPLHLYRLPKAESVKIDDGALIITSGLYFETAIIELVELNNASADKIVVECDNKQGAFSSLEALKVSTWDKLTETSSLSTLKSYRVSLTEDVLNSMSGKSYSISVKMIGNSNQLLGTISSEQVTELSNLIATKLHTNVNKVEYGVLEFNPYNLYEGTNLNYSFIADDGSSFWKETSLFRITITAGNGVYSIYAVDYYSFIKNFDVNVSSANYALVEDEDLYAYVRYSYTDPKSDTIKYLYFNVYKENKINLRDSKYIPYYPIDVQYDDGYIYTGASVYSTINLEEGGSFAVSINMLGGDSYILNGKNMGHLSAASEAIKTFVRYGANQLSTHNGMVQFQNLSPIRNDSAIDYPLYKLTVTPFNYESDEEIKVFYLYYNTEDEAKTIAKRSDSNFESATYVKLELLPDVSGLLFDLSKYFEAGNYNVSILTLAGMGVGEGDDFHYLLDAKKADSKPYQKLTDTYFEANKGYLMFDRAYTNNDQGNTFYDNEEYEITLISEAGVEYKPFVINKDTEGVTVDKINNKIIYVLPTTMTLGEDQVNIGGGIKFNVKVKALSNYNFILNGTYAKADGVDKTLSFEKAKGVEVAGANRLRIEDGVLKWKVTDMINFSTVVINIDFEEKGVLYNIVIDGSQIDIADIKTVEKDGVYQYHYYEFKDTRYPLLITGESFIKSGIDYNISIMVVGKSTAERNIVNSDYSSKIVATRLAQVTDSSIKTNDGILQWGEIVGASNYVVTITNDKGDSVDFTTTKATLNLLEVAPNLAVGNYSVKVKAFGNVQINAMMSQEIEGFYKLGAVSNKRINAGNIAWDKVDNAAAYQVIFEYVNTKNQAVTTQPIITSELYCVAPNDIASTVKVYINAVGVGEGKLFNGPVSELTISIAVPTQVGAITYDDENNRYVWTVSDDDFFDNDTLLVKYDFAKYVSDNELDAAESADPVTITYRQKEYYDATNNKYYFPISEIGVYTNFSVQVIREHTLPSNAVIGVEKTLKLFSFGAGTTEDPYRISTAEEMLNISYFSAAKYVLTASINMESVDYISRLEQFNAVITNEFYGELDGANYSIFGFGINSSTNTDTIELNGQTNFALFGTLNNATIKNLIVGSENNQMILSNSFAKSTSNVIKLALIATGVKNSSTIQDVEVKNFKVVLTQDTTVSGTKVLQGNVYLAGLVAEMEGGSTIDNCDVSFASQIDIRLSEECMAYIGGAVAVAKNSNVSNSVIQFTPTLSYSDVTISYIGGAIAYFTGNAARSYGISDTDVAINIENVPASHIGGLVGFAQFIKIANSKTSGTFTYSGVDFVTNIGGLIGSGQSSVITNSGTRASFDIVLYSTADRYVGAIAGKLTVVDGLSCTVDSCYYVTDGDYMDQTIHSIDEIVLGACGYKTDVTITNGYKYEN